MLIVAEHFLQERSNYTTKATRRTTQTKATEILLEMMTTRPKIDLHPEITPDKLVNVMDVSKTLASIEELFSTSLSTAAKLSFSNAPVKTNIQMIYGRM